MDIAPHATGALLLINLLFASIALAIGFAAGGWFFSGRDNNADRKQSGDLDSEEQEAKIGIERTILASQRLCDLATSIVTDVGEHSDSMSRISAGLDAMRTGQDDASVEAVVGVVEQIAEANSQLQERLEKAEQQIQAQAAEIAIHESEARTDSLTKINNRRAFDDELGRRMAEWQRKSTPFSLLIMDVDHFKRFNDTHGHQAGDEVLRKVAATIEACAREMDVACRYGGEEFAVVMPATAGRDACKLAERIRTSIEKLSITFEGKALSVTMSLGVAQACDADDTCRIIRRADEALYASKSAGRNATHIHDKSQCAPVTPGIKQPESGKKPAAEEDIPKAPTTVLDKLPNRTMLAEELRRCVPSALKKDQPLSMVGVELRDYKELSNEYGTAIARLTLDSVAQFLTGAFENGSFLAKLQEGQFAAMLTGSSEAEARLAGQRIAEALSKCSIPLGDGELKLETNISITCLEDHDTPFTLLARTEKSLTHSHGEMAITT
ncbi:Response regulator PleD [Pseudobythopirellula maris]|uniref:diguanylate cyclase n=1 Tax=Pseudobythopirellula maris TaxID=2527991 RepID=A0A5C5ZQ59_9BACT|nr:diguanylate cyclase [Pseudobythopirellula maris]TWT89652.1 Response regulator PleD [Pseudobythopirellula maris]